MEVASVTAIKSWLPSIYKPGSSLESLQSKEHFFRDLIIIIIIIINGSSGPLSPRPSLHRVFIYFTFWPGLMLVRKLCLFHWLLRLTCSPHVYCQPPTSTQHRYTIIPGRARSTVITTYSIIPGHASASYWLWRNELMSVPPGVGQLITVPWTS
jgi:hypothetical protein